MNQKIKELAEQSGVVESHVDWEAAGGVLLEKFAKLIIQQCMDMVIAHEDDAPEEFHKLWLHMKEHFGVE